MSNENEPKSERSREPGYYWVRNIEHPEWGWEIGEVNAPAVREVYLIGSGPGGFPVVDFEFGPRIEPPANLDLAPTRQLRDDLSAANRAELATEEPVVDFQIASIDGDTIRLVSGDGPLAGSAADLMTPTVPVDSSICRGCGRTDCPAPAARAAYDTEKARIDKEQADDCRRRGDWSNAFPLIPIRERYALDDAERDCKAAHTAAWERYLADRAAAGPPPSVARWSRGRRRRRRGG